jgi:hypothetical protein
MPIQMWHDLFHDRLLKDASDELELDRAARAAPQIEIEQALVPSRAHQLN